MVAVQQGDQVIAKVSRTKCLSKGVKTTDGWGVLYLVWQPLCHDLPWPIYRYSYTLAVPHTTPDAEFLQL
jgi:hypothetical protein